MYLSYKKQRALKNKYFHKSYLVFSGKLNGVIHFCLGFQGHLKGNSIFFKMKYVILHSMYILCYIIFLFYF